MVKLSQPDMIIFRMFDDEEEHLFAQVMFNEDNKLDTEARLFTVAEGDSYRELDFDQIMLAEEVDGGSVALCSFSIGDGDHRAFVCQMDYTDLCAAAQALLKAYNSEISASKTH